MSYRGRLSVCVHKASRFVTISYSPWGVLGNEPCYNVFHGAVSEIIEVQCFSFFKMASDHVTYDIIIITIINPYRRCTCDKK